MTDQASENSAVSPWYDVADTLHSAAIHLLRQVGRHDPESGLSAARLSALSVIVFRGPMTIGELARAEQVSLPTISRMVAALEHEGLVVRAIDPADRRVVHVQATVQGSEVLHQARWRRVQYLGEQLQALPAKDFDTLAQAVQILDRLSSHGRESHEPVIPDDPLSDE